MAENVYHLQKPSLSWDNLTPISQDYDDIYYPKERGIEAAEHVFLKPNNLPQRWQNSLPFFTVCELGFGTGLNFFVTLKRWLQTPKRCHWLHFVTCEQAPLSPEDIRQALSAFPELADYLDEFLLKYPPPIRGFHRLIFEKWQVSVTFLFGEAENSLRELTGKVDAWYLDGFAPAKNGALWSENICTQIARLCVQGTTLGTYAAAGDVRRRLKNCGFTVTKIHGFENKRESIHARYDREPYTHRQVEHVAIIGGGLAGITTARALARRNIRSTIIERESSLATGASGNQAAVLVPYITKYRMPPSRLYIAGFLFSTNHFPYQRTGAIQFLSTGRLQKLYEEFDTVKLPKEFARKVSRDEVETHAGVTALSNGFLYERAGWLKPIELCTELSTHPLITIQSGVTANRIEKSESIFRIYNEADQLITECDRVVLANAYDASKISQARWLAVEAVRGQLVESATTPASTCLKSVLCYDGYCLPADNGRHLLGATYQHNNPSTKPSTEDTKEILSNVWRWSSELHFKQALSERVAFRTTTYDRFPYVGVLADNTEVERDKSENSGIYTMLGFGSRGFISCPLSAELVASMIAGEPLPLEKELVERLSSKRFILRQKKRMLTG